MKRLFVIGIPLVVLGALIGYRLNLNQQAAAKQNEVRAARKGAAVLVEVAPAAVRDIVTTVSAVGTVEAPSTVRIAPKVTGRIDYLEVHEGDAVRAGQVLVRLNADDLTANYNRQQATAVGSGSRLAQARITQSPTDVAVVTAIRQQEAAVASTSADLGQVTQNYAAQQSSAAALVEDAQGKVDAATAAVSNAQAAIRSAEANLANARAKYARIDSLYRQGFVAAQDVDDARTTVSVQESAVDVARGQAEGARAQLSSASAQKRSAEQQLSIVKTKGKADIQAADARARQAQAALEYAKANSAQKPAYQQAIASLKAASDADQAALRSAKAQLAETVLISPVDGFVTSRLMDPGAVATSGQTVLVVQAMRQVWVNLPVSEEDRGKLRQGMRAVVRFDALPGAPRTGTVSQINAAADPGSRQFVVRVTVDNPGMSMKPGMFARALFETGRVRGVVVPREAVQDGRAGQTAVVIGPDQLAQRRTVTTGLSDDRGTMIATGVNAGEKVVVMSASPLKDGAKVRLGGKPGGAGRGGRGK